ncbi:unnamed protein product [Symbiodinium natans]|uniref:Uncharacterized protein n=1 Tax=Symbiodinium natans TaxID=878477 RepID=A0A812STI5_9DINO|nr:unnamed protein product [Symbiodinium natans]
MGPFLKQLDHPKLFHDPELGLGPREYCTTKTSGLKVKDLIAAAESKKKVQAEEGASSFASHRGFGVIYQVGRCELPQSKEERLAAEVCELRKRLATMELELEELRSREREASIPEEFFDCFD